MQIQLDYSAIDPLMAKLKSMESNYKPKVEKALGDAFDEMVQRFENAVSSHYRTASTMRSSRIKGFSPRWSGDEISCPVGFDFNNHGAMHAIFLKNGTGPRATKSGKHPHSTGRMTADGAVKSALNENEMKETATGKVMDTLLNEICTIGR